MTSYLHESANKVTHILPQGNGWVEIQPGSLSLGIDGDGWDYFTALTKYGPAGSDGFNQYQIAGYCSSISLIRWGANTGEALGGMLREHVSEQDLRHWDESLGAE